MSLDSDEIFSRCNTCATLIQLFKDLHEARIVLHAVNVYSSIKVTKSELNVELFFTISSNEKVGLLQAQMASHESNNEINM